MDEQDRIVAKVNELMELCDELEDAQAVRECRRNRLAEASLDKSEDWTQPVKALASTSNARSA